MSPLRILTSAVLLILFLVPGCSQPDKKDGGKPLIGLAMETLKEERWQRDRDFFVAAAERLGADVIVQSANGDDARQIAQCENLLTQKVDILVVVPHNGKIAAAVVEMAHKSGVKVIAYDRIINDSDLDLYISFDNERVGELQGEYLVTRAPRGNYVLIGGAPTDYNSILFRKGQMNVLRPLVDKGDITIVADQWAKDWQPIEALKHTENALTQNRNNVTAVVASNDGTASGAIQALEEQGLAGKVLVSGQDAELSACQRVVQGTQAMTVYKPVRKLAEKAAEVAITMISGKHAPETNRTVNNGKIDVPSILLEPITVDKSNMVQTVIADGFHKVEEVYKNVPRQQWPDTQAVSEARR
ncbi:MAG: D-xylose ABC transporter substrate-binding protein [Ignavibacteria bacterium]|nr:D-xylose ABC transporter substrate-binding protein [Ignavibacteria bacterium]